MMIEQHYDEEVLLGLLEAPHEDPHLSSCEKCASALRLMRQMTGALHDNAVWDQRELDEEPRPATREALRSFAMAQAREDAEAEPRVKALMARPSSEWQAMVEQHPEWKTAGLVRGLIKAVDAINFTAPTDAVELTKIAVQIAEALTAASERLAKLRARAWREHAYALYYIGAFTDAVDKLDVCEKYLSGVSVGELELAEATLIRAKICYNVERLDEAMRLARNAERVFRRFGSGRRALVAEVTQGAILMGSRQYRDALAVQKRVMDDVTADPISRACAVHNAAICLRELSNTREARTYFTHAIFEFERLHLASECARARWNFANILVADGEYDAAVEVFVSAQRAFEELGMADSLALVAIDAAQALLLAGKVSEVSHICQSAIQYFVAANLTYTTSAVMALAYMREAADARDLTIKHVGEVRAFFEVLPKQPKLLFARPA